jgi:hypothetical protein
MYIELTRILYACSHAAAFFESSLLQRAVSSREDRSKEEILLFLSSTEHSERVRVSQSQSLAEYGDLPPSETVPRAVIPIYG